uniref:Uncharacterized protein n=1 Tax=viral metagenome TaxID=1070528 RepID=A0A6C0K666_9ZZZZ
MSTRRKLFQKIAGGGNLYMLGVNKSKIADFNPGSIDGLAFWTQADKKCLVYRTINKYTELPDVLPSLKDKILIQYKGNLDSEVLSEIKSVVDSQPNSFIPFHLNKNTPVNFPFFSSNPEKLDAISLESMFDTSKPGENKEIMRSKEIKLSSSNISIYSLSTNIEITYNDTLKILVISVINPSNPVIEFSEILVFSRVLTKEENEHMEGYIAYKKNEQYLLSLNHPYLPTIDSFTFLKDISTQIYESEFSIGENIKRFDVAVQTYSNKLPDAEILQKAPSLKQKAAAILLQISVVKQNLVKAALLARKKRIETLAATFEAMKDLKGYIEPFTQENLNSKLLEFKSVSTELEAYINSLDDLDKVVYNAKKQNNESEQIIKRTQAISAELLNEQKLASAMKEIQGKLRDRIEKVNKAGKNKYDVLYAKITRKIEAFEEGIKFSNTTIKNMWETLLVNFNTLEHIITSGEWLSYNNTIKTDNTLIKRGDIPYEIKYIDAYLNSIQTLYELIRNQITEGDFIFLRNEINCIETFYTTLLKKVESKEMKLISSKLFISILKKKDSEMKGYYKDFNNLYNILYPAVKELLKILNTNKEYPSTKTELKNAYPIPSVYRYKEISQQTKYVRKINKHDNSLTMIEYIFTKNNGTIDYLDEKTLEVNFFFPSLESISKNKEDNFFTKKIPFRDTLGYPLIQKFMVLSPYSKNESILDSISNLQITPRYFHIVDNQFEIPRDAVNSIYEMKMPSPQMPVLLPKYAMEDGEFFICVNVGDIAIQIRIPGTMEDIYDFIGPNEVCIYVFIDTTDLESQLYGRVQWDDIRIAYDTIYDTPRSSLCCKIDEFPNKIFMRSKKVPLFDKNGFLIEALLDDNSCIYDIDDIHRASPYKINVLEGTQKMSDLEINSDWGEQFVPGIFPTIINMACEATTGLAVFCNQQGIPAIDEFCYTKYLKSPILQINGVTMTQTSSSKNMEVVLNSTTPIVQYGKFSYSDVFTQSFRSIFVKQISPQENIFIYVSSTGFPLISPLKQYILLENFIFYPPLHLTYVENLVSRYAYIPESEHEEKLIYEIKPYTYPYVLTKEQKEARNITLEITILSYRYMTGKAYIDSTLISLKSCLSFCKTLFVYNQVSGKDEEVFSGIEKTCELLTTCIENIKEFFITYISYKSSIDVMMGKNVISDKSTDTMMEISTFDVKLKDTLGNVYKKYKIGLKATNFFKMISKKIEKIREKIKDLNEVKKIEITESIRYIQNIQIQQTLLTNGNRNKELEKIFKICAEKQTEFDGILDELNKSLNKIPKDLDALQDWVNNNQVLIDAALTLYKEINEIEKIHVVHIFTQQLKNTNEIGNKKMQENEAKIEELIKYKKKMALWLEIYTDATEQHKYTRETAIIIASTPTLKGYAISMIPFEEMENPSIERDWRPIEHTQILSISLRSLFKKNIMEQLEIFIEKYENFYTEININANTILSTDTLNRLNMDINKRVDASNKTTNEHIAKAVDAEAELKPIFDEYEKIRSDIRFEIQKVLNTLATENQSLWLDSTGKRTAFQTTFALLQPYLNDIQLAKIKDNITKMDELFSNNSLSNMDTVQRSLKVSDFYTNISYINMLKIYDTWTIMNEHLKTINYFLSEIQTSMDQIQKETLSTLQSIIQTKNNTINEEYTKLKTSSINGSELKDITSIIDTQITKLAENRDEDIPKCISALKIISEIETQLKKYSS